ncbi:hypothetical protein ACLESO_57710, partial [Pyxidicoccus sp. 3LG]
MRSSRTVPLPRNALLVPCLALGLLGGGAEAWAQEPPPAETAAPGAPPRTPPGATSEVPARPEASPEASSPPPSRETV